MPRVFSPPSVCGSPINTEEFQPHSLRGARSPRRRGAFTKETEMNGRVDGRPLWRKLIHEFELAQQMIVNLSVHCRDERMSSLYCQFTLGNPFMKRLALIIALLLMLAIAAFYFPNRQASEKEGIRTQSPTSYESVRPQVSQANPKEVPPVNSAETILAETKQKIDLIRKQHDERLARLAEITTPEVQQKMIDGQMRFREPAYRDLFESWDLDASTAEQALKIIREREVQLMETRLKFFRKGSNGAQESQQGQTIDIALAEAKLMELLGEKNLQELAKRESEMDTARKADALRKMRED